MDRYCACIFDEAVDAEIDPPTQKDLFLPPWVDGVLEKKREEEEQVEEDEEEEDVGEVADAANSVSVQTATRSAGIQPAAELRICGGR